MRRAVRPGIATMVAAGVLVACGTAPGDADADLPSGELVVFAATSLTDAIDALADEFTTTHPAVAVTISLAGSHQLAGHIVDGAPADVFLSADRARMDQVDAAGRAEGHPVVVATNRLAVAVEAGNPRGVTGLEDLARADLLVALAAPEVPAGAYAAQALAAAGVEVAPVTLEADVRSVLAKVELGEVDAGIVYESDVATSDGVDGIAVPSAVDPRPVVPAAVLTDAPNPVAARAFLGLLTSQTGRRILADHGFGAP